MNKLDAITKGSQIIDQIFWELLSILRAETNLTERRLAQFIRRRAGELGAEAQAFPPIVAFGKNSSEIHHFAATTKISRNNFLMFDFGVKIDGFCSDFTRTVFLGQPGKLHEKIYKAVLQAQRAAISKVRVGAQGDEIDFAARHIINSAGYGRNYNHGTGHGITRQIHDLPNFKANSGDVVKSGDVVTVEPGIYLPGKFGVRIEDMIVVARKPKILSQIPKDFSSMIIS